jgi:hypothetical protein
VLGQLHRRGGHADDDHERHEQLRDRDAQVAARGVQPEREALAALGVEERDVRHRRREVAAADAGRRRAGEQHPHLHVVRLVGEPAARHDDREQQRRDQQQRRAQRRPAPAAEARHRERVRDAQRRADQVRHRDEPELLRQRQRHARVREVDDHDRPQHPDAEAEVLGEDREDEVLARDPLPRLLPERRVLRAPVVDPAAAREQLRPALRICRPWEWDVGDRAHAAKLGMAWRVRHGQPVGRSQGPCDGRSNMNRRVRK